MSTTSWLKHGRYCLYVSANRIIGYGLSSVQRPTKRLTKNRHTLPAISVEPSNHWSTITSPSPTGTRSTNDVSIELQIQWSQESGWSWSGALCPPAYWHIGTRTGTISSVLIWCWQMSLGSASTTLIVLFVGCISPLAFQQHGEKLEHGHYSCRYWPSTYQQISDEKSADGSGFGALSPTCVGGGNDQESVLVIWAISSCYQMSLNRADKDTASNSPDVNTPPNSQNSKRH